MPVGTHKSKSNSISVGCPDNFLRSTTPQICSGHFKSSCIRSLLLGCTYSFAAPVRFATHLSPSPEPYHTLNWHMSNFRHVRTWMPDNSKWFFHSDILLCSRTSKRGTGLRNLILCLHDRTGSTGPKFVSFFFSFSVGDISFSHLRFHSCSSLFSFFHHGL